MKPVQPSGLQTDLGAVDNWHVGIPGTHDNSLEKTSADDFFEYGSDVAESFRADGEAQRRT
jgi:hypothetical protein